MGIDQDNFELEEEFKQEYVTPLKELKKELKRYKKAYGLLIDYWDFIPEGEDRKQLHKELEKLGL